MVSMWTGHIHHTSVKQGVQSFRLCYEGPRAEVLWYAKMFRKALKAHDKEQAAKHLVDKTL